MLYGKHSAWQNITNWTSISSIVIAVAEAVLYSVYRTKRRLPCYTGTTVCSLLGPNIPSLLLFLSVSHCYLLCCTGWVLTSKPRAHWVSYLLFLVLSSYISNLVLIYSIMLWYCARSMIRNKILFILVLNDPQELISCPFLCHFFLLFPSLSYLVNINTNIIMNKALWLENIAKLRSSLWFPRKHSLPRLDANDRAGAPQILS